jgi:hypothetical protein
VVGLKLRGLCFFWATRDHPSVQFNLCDVGYNINGQRMDGFCPKQKTQRVKAAESRKSMF